MKKKFFTGLLLLGTTLALQAQNPEANDINYWTDSVITPQFFIAVIAGVLLAMGFQFILTALSIALGITAVGNLKESYVKGKYHPNRKDNLHDFDNDVTNKNNDDDDDGMDTGTMITTGFGLWSVITVGLSLFGATALAINLALISSTIISITLGLVIWATFFILMFYLESKVVSSVIGGLINTATSGLRASGEAVKSMFTPSKETQLKNVAEDTVDKIRKDFASSFDPNVINDAIDEFFTKVDKSVPDYEKVKNDIRKIVEESDERSEKIQEQHDDRQEKIQKQSDKRQEKIAEKKGGGGSPAKWMAINNVLSNAISGSSNGDDQNKGKVEQLKRLQKELKAAYDEGDTNEERVEKAVAKLTSQEEEQVHSYIEKIKGVLSSATPDDMDSSQVQDKIMQVVKNPTVEGPKLAGKLGDLDRKTIIDILAKNTALDRQQLEKYADKIEQVLNKIKSTMGGGSSSGDTDFSDMKLKLEKEIYKLMNGSGGGSGIDFSSLTSFFQSKMDNQKDSLKSIKKNLSTMDRESIVAVVTNNTSIDRNDIDKVVQSYEDAKKNVLKRVDDIEMEANRRLENVKRKAVIHAENTRKNAAAAAWWVVISALLSAGAAIGGSLLALA